MRRGQGRLRRRVGGFAPAEPIQRRGRDQPEAREIRLEPRPQRLRREPASAQQPTHRATRANHHRQARRVRERRRLEQRHQCEHGEEQRHRSEPALTLRDRGEIESRVTHDGDEQGKVGEYQRLAEHREFRVGGDDEQRQQRNRQQCGDRRIAREGEAETEQRGHRQGMQRQSARRAKAYRARPHTSVEQDRRDQHSNKDDHIIRHKCALRTGASSASTEPCLRTCCKEKRLRYSVRGQGCHDRARALASLESSATLCMSAFWYDGVWGTAIAG